MLTGEPIPVRKEKDDKLSAGTSNGSSSLVMQADRVGGNTLLSQIVHMVAQAQRSRAPVQRLVDLVAVSVLIIACPYALGLALWSCHSSVEVSEIVRA